MEGAEQHYQPMYCSDAFSASITQQQSLCSLFKESVKGCGGGLVVSVLAFYSDDPSSIPAEVYNFFCKIVVENNENKQKEAGVGPIFLKKVLMDTFFKNPSR